MTIQEKHDVVVVAGGQAGLAMSYYLRAQNREHVILERSRLAERWRSERWNSLCFQFPNWSLQLPGYAYSGNDPHGFSRRDDITQFIENYARFIDAPVRCGANVESLERDSRSGRFLISTGDSVIEASSVVIATGPFQRPLVPAMALEFPPAILQLHASRYIEPGQLPDGAVLVVGSGSSGCQIAQELNEFGRTVYLSVGRHRRAPRRYRGRDLLWWAMKTERFDVTVDRLPEGRTPPTIILTGIRGGSDMNVRTLSANGVVVLGRPTGITGSRLTLKDDAEFQLAQADGAAREFTESVDTYLQEARIDPPAMEPAADTDRTPWERIEPKPELRPESHRGVDGDLVHGVPVRLRLGTPAHIRRAASARAVPRNNELSRCLFCRTSLDAQIHVGHIIWGR